MLMCCQSEDTSLAQEACEFWITAADMSENDLIGPHLQSILPVILNRMCYTEEDIEWLKVSVSSISRMILLYLLSCQIYVSLIWC